MDNFDSLFTPKENTQSRQFSPIDKQAWAEKKQAERKAVYEMIDTTAEEMCQDSELFQLSLDIMARFDRYSVGNVLLIAKQMPEATKLADFETWKQSRVYVRKGEDHIKLLVPGEEFIREDGSPGVNYNVKHVFDITQTSSRSKPAQVNHDMRLLLKSMLRNAPCVIEISDKVPDGVGAFYSPDDRKIYVRAGMDGPDIFRCLSQELAHAHMDKGPNYNRSTGPLLEKEGYVIKVLDLINMDKSHCYNPFKYLHSDNDIQRLVTNLFKNTTPKGSQSQDPFWDQAASMLLLALIFYLHYEAPEDEQNFSMVMEMIRAGEVQEEGPPSPSVLDEIFDRLEMKDPDHIALKYYRNYRSGSAKTLKSIQITLVARLEKFNLDSLAGITQTDEMELDKVGERKTAIFAVIPDNDSSFNFLVGMLYTQLFQQLYHQADFVYGGRLKEHVHFLMDEFANVALPDDFPKLLSTMRSREISVSIILQNIAQLKALFEKDWESIMGNCDEFLYLGGNEQSTHKYVSDLLGKETIDSNTYGKSRGRNGSYTTNYQISGRELMTPDEVRMLDNRYAILFIRGERPLLDLKYDILKHPNVRYSADGEAAPYQHGVDIRSCASFTCTSDKKVLAKAQPLQVDDKDFLLFCDEDAEEILKQIGGKQDENQ